MAVTKPQVFIASSTEGLNVAEAMKSALEPDVDCTIWSEGVFQLNSFTLLDLESLVRSFDYGVFVFSPDDIATIRNEQTRVVRDNVYLELGMFIGRNGLAKCFIVQPDGVDDFHLATDIAGLTIAAYNPSGHGGNLTAELGSTAIRIKNQITKNEEKLKEELDETLYRTASQIIRLNSKEGVIVPDLRNTMFSKVGSILRIVAGDEYYEDYHREITLTPNEDGSIINRKTRTVSLLHTQRSMYNWDQGKGWFESYENREDYQCTKLILDGVDCTELYNASRTYIDRDKTKHYSTYGHYFGAISFPAAGLEHSIEHEVIETKHISNDYVYTTHIDVPNKRRTLQILISGPNAYKWTIQYLDSSAFHYASSSDAKLYSSEHQTMQLVTVKCDDWVFPGAGYMYVVRPVTKEDLERFRIESI
ncbi:MAG: nucleotide-binding protein [Coriobacteriia bacterium]|nr:nucleotide-binding protein [Coriobacteriia bacterium]